MVSKTNEFRAALEDANEAAREIIESNGLIYGKDYTYDKNSLIRFNDDVLDNITTQALEFKNRTSLAADVANWHSATAEQ